VDWKLAVVVVPVADIDRAKDFYVEKLGFVLDVDYSSGAFRVVQLTPPGSACSISFVQGGSGSSEPGSIQGLHLVVGDIEAARAELVGRGADVSDFFHFGASGRADGLQPERADYGTFVSFEDPDGNGWLVQEVRSRQPSTSL
jgi:catechol 2,3-dioxygenase-like lactoylglutathione lyase family enzyme